MDNVARELVVDRLIDAVRAIRAVDATLQVQELALLMLLPGDGRSITVSEIARLAGFTAASATECLRAMGSETVHGRGPLGLVRLVGDVRDPTRTRCTLSEAGQRLALEICNRVSGHANSWDREPTGSGN